MSIGDGGVFVVFLFVKLSKTYFFVIQPNVKKLVKQPLFLLIMFIGSVLIRSLPV